MPALTAETTDYRLDIDAGQRCHWTVGRDPSCELYIEDKGVSRFHATVFSVGDGFHVIDHSLNGTHLFRTEDEFRVALSTPIARTSGAAGDVVGFETCRIEPVEFKVPTIEGLLDGPPFDLHQSVTELKIQQVHSDVPRIPGHEHHTLTDADRLKPLLDMIYGDEAEFLAGMARPVAPGNVLLFCGHDRHFFRFVE